MRDPLVTALRQAAVEIAGWGAGNEAAIVRQAADRIEKHAARGTPAPANDGCGTVIVDVAHYEREIRRLQNELATTRQELAEAKIAIGWARNAGLEEAAKIAGGWLQSSWQDEVFAARSIADAIRERTEKGPAAAFPFQTEEAKER